MNNKRYSILVFDSGVGGLSIAQTLHKKLPEVSLHYLSDNAAFPYGTKSSSYLIKRTAKILQIACQTINPDIIVVAYNTASTLTLATLRTLFKIPIVGVVPAIKPAAILSQSKTIGLLATPGTVSRTYTQQLIDDFASDCQVLTLGSNFLVTQAEDKLRGKTMDLDGILNEVSPFASATIDTVVLACTHFPLLKKELALALPSIKYWVDSAEAIANRVRYLLSTTAPHDRKPTESACYFTKDDPSNRHLKTILDDIGINHIYTLSNDL